MLNRIEIFNEMLILILTYFCWTFSDYQPDVALKDELGWNYIYTLLLAIFVNIGFMFYNSAIKPCINRKKKKIEKKDHHKLHKERERFRVKKSEVPSYTMEGLMEKSQTGLSMFSSKEK